MKEDRNRREEMAERFGEEYVEHTEWWAEEMDFCRDKLHPLLEQVRNDPEMQLARHGTSTNSDGDHEVRLSFTVYGEPWEGDE